MPQHTIPADQTGPDAPTEGAQQQAPQQGGQEGQLLAGKYQSQEDLEKGTLELLKKQYPNLEEFYKSLESQQGTPQEQQQQQQNPQEQQQTDDQTEAQRGEAKNLLEQQGLKIEDFESEFQQNGELSEESYNKLTQALPKQVVDSYIEGQKALAERTSNELLSTVGGQEAFDEMSQWAAENLSKEEIEYFNKQVTSNDMTQAKWALSGLYSRYQMSTGKTPGQQKAAPPNLVQGQSQSQATISGYSSKAEMIRDMQDSRYSSDPAFRKQVQDKLARTTSF